MVHGVRIDYGVNIFFFRKKHYCEKCNALLLKEKNEVIVDSWSEESRNYDFFDGCDSYAVGNIKFIKYYLKCPTCNTVVDWGEQQMYESELHRNKKSEKKRLKCELKAQRKNK